MRTRLLIAASVGALVVSLTAAPPVTPLNDLGSGFYLGAFQGGLYRNGQNVPPSDHHAVGLSAAATITPLDALGVPSPLGKIGLVPLGMSNVRNEWCAMSDGDPVCIPESVMGKAAADPLVNHTTLEIVQGAQGGKEAEEWDSPLDPTYDVVRDRLAARGLTEAQVQIVWIKNANRFPAVSLPAANADAYVFEATFGNIVRAAATRYPNLKQIFLGSRIYGGYGNTAKSPEPYCYEYGFSMKWLIDAQIEQRRTGTIDPQSGDLSGVPWMAWGPYLWADGKRPRSDGLKWLREDFQADGTHPSPSGVNKVSSMILAFFKNSSYTACWFLAGGSC